MQLSITLLIIAFTCIVSYQGFNRYEIIDRFKHSPYREWSGKEWYRILTSGFVHADWMHLIINMYVMYFAGQAVESAIVEWYGDPLGRLIFFIMYMLNIIIANLPTTLKQKHNPGYGSIGASGAISGLLFIVILFSPWSTFSLFFVIPIYAVLLGAGYLIYSSWAANKQRSRMDHSAHFAGALAGMAMIILIHREIVTDFFYKLIHEFPL